MNRHLACKALTMRYRGADGSMQAVLDKVDVRFEAGRLTLVSGPTGVGKSTLLRLLAGLQRPEAGEVVADGQAISRWTMPHLDRWRRQVGLVFQQPVLLHDLTVLENVMLPLIPRTMPVSEIRRAAHEGLTMAGVAHLAAEPGANLSGGESQRVMLARALAVEPHFLLTDEPTAHQDPQGLEIVLAALAAAARRGCLIVAATHDKRFMEAELAADHYVLQDAALRKQG